MLACGACNHPLVFHKAQPDGDPCYLCPRGRCLVGKCRCRAYEGALPGPKNHDLHEMAKVKWGDWGLMLFSSSKELAITSTSQPAFIKQTR